MAQILNHIPPAYYVGAEQAEQRRQQGGARQPAQQPGHGHVFVKGRDQLRTPEEERSLQIPVEFFSLFGEDQGMENHILPPELLAEMEKAALNSLTNVRDPEAMKKACERMDRMSEEVRKKHGILDIGVPAIRELRDE